MTRISEPNGMLSRLARQEGPLSGNQQLLKKFPCPRQLPHGEFRAAPTNVYPRRVGSARPRQKQKGVPPLLARVVTNQLPNRNLSPVYWIQYCTARHVGSHLPNGRGPSPTERLRGTAETGWHAPT
jgi:hypothetical protein